MLQSTNSSGMILATSSGWVVSIPSSSCVDSILPAILGFVDSINEITLLIKVSRGVTLLTLM